MGHLPAEEIQKATCTTHGFAFSQVLTVDEIISKIQTSSARSWEEVVILSLDIRSQDESLS
jgi:hypothetical protein